MHSRTHSSNALEIKPCCYSHYQYFFFTVARQMGEIVSQVFMAAPLRAKNFGGELQFPPFLSLNCCVLSPYRRVPAVPGFEWTVAAFSLQGSLKVRILIEVQYR